MNNDKNNTIENDGNFEVVPVIDLTDNRGKTKTFEILADVEDEGYGYVVLAPYIEDISKKNENVTVMVMRKCEDVDGNPSVEDIEDIKIKEKIFGMFIEELKKGETN